MRVQRAKQDLGVGRRLGQPETARVAGVVLEPKREFHLRGDMLRKTQLQREAIEETSENEEQRFERLDFVFKFHRRGKALCRRDEMEWARIAAGSALPQRQTLAPEAADDLVAR